MSNEFDPINRAVWASAPVRRIFARRQGWMDPGEALVMERIAEEAGGRSIIDIGVGAGRTLPYLRSLSDDYVAIDYVEELVQLTRARFPGARVEHGDARALDAFADASIDVAVFSFNGIDGVGHEDRPRVFRAVARVLRPGGLFAYSTHNLDHRLAGRAPWHPSRFHARNGVRPLVGSLVRLPKSVQAYRRLRDRTLRGDGWASLVDSAYSFSVVWHYVTVEQAIDELRTSGFTGDVEVYSTAGARVDLTDDTSESPWLHFVARKPRSSCSC